MSILRLKHLREQCEAVEVDMCDERERFKALKGEETRTVTAFNLFQTPTDIAARMAAKLFERIGTYDNILEPSAGLGRLYAAISPHGGAVTLCEQSADCCAELYKMTEGANAKIRQGDFLAMDLPLFGGVIMNPPFKMWRDIKHIKHAATLLKTGGRLVALCANGPRQRAKLMPMCDEWTELDAGSFKSEGTNVNVAMVVIDR